jgi:hypothetical protein
MIRMGRRSGRLHCTSRSPASSARSGPSSSARRTTQAATARDAAGTAALYMRSGRPPWLWLCACDGAADDRTLLAGTLLAIAGVAAGALP